ncbi:D-alanyl-D-alanine carboxypeptidase [Rhodococcus sp. AD45-ID]|uniref:serine hydrolase domain-containing protein n=1 Tax=unclassified Rhodococcus (in: high G+C Gram-positive bacteria) TaxID=192944 RepID=UPI0005D2EB2A|nr:MULTISPECIES: serine hydrolase domain-containing protein [unclassified Rhodococcus (in: high G+C Gram-positive bacteria)]KJF20714.1 D-alanyl-D-alanine carboxypeptidase precursor [Rhodococcus sp. AD45]PSR38305.1 D-alanyl-D-alanine carboxypeptidase [Rhodococcus sp. AD45-ID]ROZ44495.1 class A beta-lactamase-related serine hydrolase [Rhodococcus sp. WS3]
MKSISRQRRTRLAVIALAVTALASCGSNEDTTTGTSSPASSTVSPESQKIDDIVRTQVTELGLSGAVYGVWRGDTNVVTGAVGESPLGVPATTDMQLRVGQPMEPMLSTVLLQLDESGTLPLDEPIAKWEPSFPRSDQITPRMLANSTTGISDYVTNPEFEKRFYANPILGWTAQEILDLANTRPPLFAPGTSFAYSHSDLTLLGEVVQKAAGQSLSDLLQQRIFDPLGMTDSRVALNPQIPDPVLHGYTTERGVFEDSTFWNPTAFLHSGNMNSTVTDVGKWVRALGTGELLSDTVFDEQMAPTTAGLGPLTDDKFFTFGTAHLDGWLVMNPSYGGYNGVALYEPKSETTIVIYATLGPTANANGNNAVPISNTIGAVMVPDNPPQVPGP